MKRLMVLFAKAFRRSAIRLSVAGVLLLCVHGEGNCAESATLATAKVDHHPSGASLRWHESLQSGWSESVQLHLPMLIFISSDHCAYCDAMQRDTWCDPTIQQKIGSDFVAIHLTPERNEATLKRIKIDRFPTTLIGVPEGRIIGFRTGYQPVAAIRQFLNEALAKPR